MAQPELVASAWDGLPARLTGPWVLDKNYYLERYLDIFTRGVGRKWAGKLAYIDRFAGPGRSVIRETGEEVEGSPLASLKCDFAWYVFVDSPEVLSILNERLKGHAKYSKISLIEGDCNTVVDAVRKASPANHLTLAFIDPTGLQIQFRTIQQLVDNRKMDLLMTIQLGMAIRMNLPLYTRAEGATLSAFLGTNRWREDVEAGGSTSQITRRVLNRYMSELRSLGYQTVQDREIEVLSDQSNLLL